ncbi:hypothetical protein RMN57_03865 [Kitasatospora sp. CM 4170]|uniref:Uncharacterized protein n=1 Tax=Kitasatospora aburaviensis TaxID=67265 RepID=A0ABW1F843_9ACTN|nr:hypothetical protein [Kitasatospora sp. CM 4170]WNM43903.1 hypothetical protein RMN57_03865 [Kitasatospora sp. CM 4170]
MRIRPIMLIAATAAAIATAGGMATAATGTSTPTPTAHGEPSATPTASASGAGSAGASVVPGSGPSVTRSTATPAAFTVTSTSTTPIDAGAVPGILASCLGSDASQYHAVIAVRTPVASADTDGVVIAVNSANQYVQCESKGNKGNSRSVPATFINDRLWGTGHLIEFFDSLSAPAGAGQRLSLGAGHYTPEVAKVTISYGDDPTQYPTVMAGGAFVYTAAVSTSPDGNSFPPAPYVHAYNADGKEIYNQKTQPTAKNTRR